jgi:Ca2+-binding RTX toxin-like protein
MEYVGCSQVPSIAFNLSLGESLGSVSESVFGVNTLFHADLYAEGSDFRKVTDAVRANSVRYPGGTIAEQFFDLTNPNATFQQNVLDVINGESNIRTREVQPLGDFLQFCFDTNRAPIVVLPTFRFFDQKTREISKDAETQIRDFVHDILTENYGKIGAITFEIGNEWYQSNFNWTVEEFGALQSQIAQIVSREASRLGSRDEVLILAQAAQDNIENSVLSSFFHGEKARSIDGVATHFYGTNKNGNLFAIGSGIDSRLDDINETWSTALGPDFVLAVTEWNVGESGPETTQITGLERSLPLLRMFYEMISNGVDMATFWSAQTLGPAGLSSREGMGSDLTATGYLIAMLAKSVSGSTLIDTSSTRHIRDTEGNAIGDAYVFVNGKDSTSIFVSGTSNVIELQVDFSSLYGAEAYVFATRLGAAPEYTGTEYWTNAAVSYQTDIQPHDDLSGAKSFEIVLGAYEVVQVSVIFGHGVELTGDTQNEIIDSFCGTGFNDRLFGKLGDDSIFGGAGDDLLEGGVGNDTLEGGADHDSIYGGSGDDILVGDHGRDYLSGGEGNDTLFGGNWHDTLAGGSGDDRIAADAGNDYLIFTSGNDTIDGGEGQDTIAFESQDHGVSVWASEGFVETAYGLVSITNLEVVVGSEMGDNISGSGMDFDKNQISRVYGMSGDDFIRMFGGSESYVDCGTGDDLVYFSSTRGTVIGGSGDDAIFALNGGGRFDGGSGDDSFSMLNRIEDTFVFTENCGNDVISGFHIGEDVVEISKTSFPKISIQVVDEGTLIHLGAHDSVLLRSVFEPEIHDSLVFV